MAQRLAVEQTIYEDLYSRLTAAGVPDIHPMGVKRTATQRGVGIGISLQGSLPAGTLPTGFYKAAVIFDCHSHQADDPTAEGVWWMMRVVREAVLLDTIVALLNAGSYWATYYGMEQGPDDGPRIEDREWHGVITLTLVMQPSNSSSTTTTSTSTGTTTSTSTSTTTTTTT